MALNYFLGWSQPDLEAELRSAQEDLAAGKATTRAGAGDANVESMVDIKITERIRLILAALNVIDPEKYPIGQVSQITQTRVAFSVPMEDSNN